MAGPAMPPEERRPTGTRPHRHEPPTPRPQPPRPPLTIDDSSPLTAPAPSRPPTATLAAVLWSAVCLAGVAGLIATMADGAALRERLAATARESDPTATAELVDDGVRTSVLLLLGVDALLVLVTLVGVVLFLRRRPWARWLLLTTGLLTAVAADVTQSIVSGGVDLDRIAFLTQLALVLCALVVLFLPATRRWLRSPGD